MTLEELIKTLEGAQEEATEGEWHRHEDHLRKDVMHIGCPGERGFIAIDVRLDDAKAIAVRHNTGPEVLRYLERARQTEREWDRRSSTLHECIAEQRTRADKSEAEVERLKANPDLSWMPTDPTP